MSAFTSKETVGPIPAAPPRYSLLQIALAESQDRWQGGIEWTPESCTRGQGLGLECDGSTADIEAVTSPSLHTADPFVVAASDRCSTIGFAARDYEGRARRILAAQQSRLIANEFWNGTIRDAKSLDNTALVDANCDLTCGDPASVVTAFGLLEEALAQYLGGRPGMLHVSPSVFTHAKAAFLFDLVGQVWRTPMGNAVVCDAGYLLANGPGGGTDLSTSQWAYATGEVRVFIGEVLVVPGPLPEAVAAATDRATNTLTLYAERLALIQWDDCCHCAAEIDLPLNCVTTD